MKFLWVFFAVWQFSALGQTSEYLLTVEFVKDTDTFPDCTTLFYSNGQYNVDQQQLIEIDLPNVTAVHPIETHSEGYLNIRSLAVQEKEAGGQEFDQVQLVPYSRDEVIALIRETADSSRAVQFVNDKRYLWRKFSITRDAKPVEKVIYLDTAVSVKVPAILPVDSTSGILDGVFLPEGGYVRLEPLKHKHIPQEFLEKSQDIREYTLAPKLDSILRPFYLSNYELTNGEYREFIKWVYDSIELHMAYDSLSNENALWLLNCSKRERKSLDPTKKMENRNRFGLTNTNKKKISEHDWTKATQGMFYPMPMRYYNRRETNPHILFYKQSGSNRIAVFPDTSGFRREELGMTGGYLANISWHPAYANYPVVNLSKSQILAYCHWKQRKLNEQFNDEGIKVSVRPPYLSEYEFATKTSVGSPNYLNTFSHPNTYFTVFQRDHPNDPIAFYRRVNYEPYEQRKSKSDRKNPEPSLNYLLWYQANTVPESPFKFLNGNVSEFVLDTINAETWQAFEMGNDQPSAKANYVLGTNFYTDAKTKGDDQFNASMYKSFLIDGQSSPYVGVRLVYITEKMGTD